MTLNIKFTILTIFKGALKWHLGYSHCCATITIIHSQNSFRLAKLELYALFALVPYSPFPPAPWSHHTLVSMNLTALVISHKWNENVFPFVTGLFCSE